MSPSQICALRSLLRFTLVSIVPLPDHINTSPFHPSLSPPFPSSLPPHFAPSLHLDTSHLSVPSAASHLLHNDILSPLSYSLSMFNKVRAASPTTDETSSLAFSSDGPDEDLGLQIPTYPSLKKPRTFRIVRISCRSLRSVDATGNHPYVVVKFDGLEVSTEKMPNAGANPVFDKLDLTMTVDKASVQTKVMTISVYDHNGINAHTLIGTGSTSISELLNFDSQQQVPFPVDLRYTDKKGMSGLAGRLELSIYLDKKPKSKMTKAVQKIRTLSAFKNAGASASAQQESTRPVEETITKPRVIRVMSASCYGLKSVLISGNAPFIVFEWENLQLRTHYVSKAGSGVDFGTLDLSMIVEKASIKEKEMTVSIYNHSDMTAPVLIGSGAISIAPLLKFEAGQAVPFALQLLAQDKRGAVTVTGHVNFELVMQPKDVKPLLSLVAVTSTARKLSDMVTKPVRAVVAANAQAIPAVLCVDKIDCTELSNVEVFGKNDPYVLLQFDSQECRTAHIENAGDHALFEGLGMRLRVSEADIASKAMMVEVYHHNDVMAPVLIGSGALSLAQLLPFKNGQEKEFRLTLLKVSKGKSKVTGKIALSMNLSSEGAVTSVLIGTSAKEVAKLTAARVNVASNLRSSSDGPAGNSRTQSMYNPLNAFQATDPVDESEPQRVEIVTENLGKPKTVRFLRLDCKDLKIPVTKKSVNVIATIAFAGQLMRSAVVLSGLDADVLFEHMDMVMTVEKDVVAEERVMVSLHHRIGNTDTLIGSGSSSIATLLQLDKGDIAKVTVELECMDRKGKLGPGGGRAELYVVRGKAHALRSNHPSSSCCIIS